MCLLSNSLKSVIDYWVARNSSPVPVPSPEKWGGLASGKASGCKTLWPKPMDSSRESDATPYGNGNAAYRAVSPRAELQ
ncbi:hypothetical protein SK128_019026 [Halocaridina rubra]|uniref:Uncharacterized protein n=1 Tax=Halocaridina rubra TaxID=373956 RepID=A0AAN8WK38_HALRR